MAHQRRRVLGALAISTIALAACGDMMPMRGGAAGSSTAAGSTAPVAGGAISARLSGAAEVPPVTSAATGSFDGSLTRDSNVLRYKITYSGLSGPATAAHIHGPVPAGQNAGVMVPFTSAASPIEGEATLTASQVADLLAGRLYVNVHTAAHPGGEIRGQLQPSTAAALPATRY